MSDVNLMTMIGQCGARICGGTQYQWSCYGTNARYMDFADVAGNEYAHIVHDTITNTVYEIAVFVPGQDQAFGWYNPDYHERYLAECAERGFEAYEAWDKVKYSVVDVETILQYAKDVGELYYDDLPVPEDA
jgi:hypothetical protein